MTKMTIAAADSWFAIYIDEELIEQESSFDYENLVQLTIDHDVTEVIQKSVNDDWYNQINELPQDLTDVIWDGDPYEPTFIEDLYGQGNQDF